MPIDPKTAILRARECLEIERDAIRATSETLGQDFVDVLGMIEATLDSGRKLIFSGVGKSAHICQKLAGTFNSIGAPANFLDATQALHGDLGLCAEGDLAFLLSNSGQTEELLRVCPILRRFGVKVVAITGHPDSPLAAGSDKVLGYSVPREACPLKLAPTASTTAALALGDALAMVLLESRGLSREDFAKFHPAGNLGMVLLLKVDDIMRTGDRLAMLDETAPTQDAILAMTKAKAGILALTGEGGRLSGVFTDGDFRRSALAHPDFLGRPVSEFMTRAPRTIAAGSLAIDALRVFEAHRIDDLVVTDADGRPVGVVDGQDLPKLKFY